MFVVKNSIISVITISKLELGYSGMKHQKWINLKIVFSSAQSKSASNDKQNINFLINFLNKMKLIGDSFHQNIHKDQITSNFNS